MLSLRYMLSRGPTEIILGDGALPSIGKLEDSLVVYPHSLRQLVESGLRGNYESLEINDGEESKSFETVLKILGRLMEGRFKRTSTLVSVGGGTVSDVAGLAASLYLRGIPYTSVPTTLLSMVDASLGGKNGVNFRGVKNVLGTFYGASRIVVDTSLLRTMPHNLVNDGIGEIAKYAAIMDDELYSFLMENTMDGVLNDQKKTEYLLSKCINDKMELVSQDEFDQNGKRIILNFGHTFGHAMEAASGFSIGHGHAVIGGMLLEADFALEMGLTTKEVQKGLQELIGHLGFSVHGKDYLPGGRAELSEFVASDKKSTRHTVKLPIPQSIGIPKVCEVETSSISDYLERK